MFIFHMFSGHFIRQRSELSYLCMLCTKNIFYLCVNVTGMEVSSGPSSDHRTPQTAARHYFWQHSGHFYGQGQPCAWINHNVHEGKISCYI